MRYAHLLSRLTGTPWLITEDSLTAITDLLEARIFSGAAFAEAAAAEDGRADPVAIEDVSSPVALIRAHGIFGKHLSMMEMMCGGGCDYDVVTNLVAEAAADPGVRAIVLHFNSPGGMAVGAAEGYAEINRIRALSGKLVVAVCDTKCCSAAMYLASACDAVYCTPSAQMGSVGAMLTIEDRSAKLATDGRRRLTIKSAAMKDIGNPDRAPTPEELAVLQNRIDYLGAMFVRDVQAGRPGVAAEVFEKGLSYFGEQALAVGLVDAVVPSIASVIAQLETLTAAPDPGGA